MKLHTLFFVLFLAILSAMGAFSANVKITLFPEEAGDAGGNWRIESGDWLKSNEVAYGLPSGYIYTASFKEISGWITPSDKTIEIPSGVSWILTTAGYTRDESVPSGSLTCILSPQGCIDAGAQWCVDGGTWKNSGETVNILAVGTHTIYFKPIQDWNSPQTKDITILEGQTAEATGIYEFQGVCDDGVSCTIDTNDPVAGCLYTPDDSLCDDGDTCTEDICDSEDGDADAQGCVHRWICDEGEGEVPYVHPADLNEDWRISMSDAIAYLTGWQQGDYLMNYAIRAAYLWQNGEQYTCNLELEPPQCWVLSSSAEGEE